MIRSFIHSFVENMNVYVNTETEYQADRREEFEFYKQHFFFTLVASSTCAIRNCFSMPKECKKLPPKTKESLSVYTACIQPVGMKNVLPSVSTTRPHFSTESPKNISPCLPDSTHCSYSCMLCSLGGISQNTCNARR